jgi:hypothetical protein
LPGPFARLNNTSPRRVIELVVQEFGGTTEIRLRREATNGCGAF